MDAILQIIGSIASIASIPLAIYFYLKGQSQKYVKARKEIVKMLSHQIGEERKISVFEVKLSIDSKLREIGGSKNAININEIVEDLTAETISNPLLPKERKDEIVENLKEIYSKDLILKLVDQKGLTTKQVAQGLLLSESVDSKTKSLIQENIEQPGKDVVPINQELKKLEEESESTNKERVFEVYKSFIFILIGMISGLWTILETAGFFKQEIFENISIEIILSVIVGLSTLFASILIVSRTKNKKKTATNKG